MNDPDARYKEDKIDQMREELAMEKEKKEKESQRLTFDDLANLYDKAHRGGRPARTKPIHLVMQWAEGQPNKFFYDEDEYLCAK